MPTASKLRLDGFQAVTSRHNRRRYYTKFSNKSKIGLPMVAVEARAESRINVNKENAEMYWHLRLLARDH